MRKLRVFECFAGVGSQRMALRNLGIAHEIVGISEIDKHALISYKAIHGDCPNFGDISKINPNELPDMDLFTYSFPCQDLSVAGKQRGLGEGTRSGLLYECEKIIETKKPKYLLLENVKNLVGKKFKGYFDEWLAYLRGLGYTNYWKVLNAKDYGVPQNRERVFVVSILNSNQVFTFPKPIALDKVTKDLLEDDVAGKYYVNKPFKLIDRSIVKGEFTTIKFDQDKRIYGIDSYLPTLRAQNHTCNILIKTGLLSYKGKEVELPCIVASRGRYLENPSDRTVGRPTEQVLEVNTRGTSNTLTTVLKDNYVMDGDYRVRKLTPLEYWRFMGFTDEDFHMAKNAGVSDTQLYKQAGNSIVTTVLEGIFTNLFIDIKYISSTNTLFNKVFRNLK